MGTLLKIFSLIAMFSGMYATFSHDTDYAISMYFFSLLFYLTSKEKYK